MPICTTYPAEPFRPYVAAHYEELPMAGWNAGANSAGIQSGDCYLSWKVTADCVGAVTGFCAPDRESYVYYDITHGIHTTSTNGVLVAQVVERGVLRGEIIGFAATDLLYIRRVSGRVEYYINTTRFYTSTVLSRNSIRAGTALFLANDEVI